MFMYFSMIRVTAVQIRQRDFGPNASSGGIAHRPKSRQILFMLQAVFAQ
jgi:hypothetical protein